MGTLVEQLLSIVVNRISEKKDSEKSSIRWSAAVWILQIWSERTDAPTLDHETKNRVRRDIFTALIKRDEMYVVSKPIEEIWLIIQNDSLL
jgi:hypothetical protein